jgi:hypothetical protein
MLLFLTAEARNAMLAGLRATLGQGALLRFFAGPTLLATVTFPGDWLTAPVDGVMQIAGSSYSNPAQNQSGVPDTGRFYKADGATLVAEADVSGMAGTGVIRLSNPVITKDEAVVVMQLTFAMPSGA